MRRVLHGADRLVGRRNVVRGGWFLWLESRLDGSNSIDSNGEQLVQTSLNLALGPG